MLQQHLQLFVNAMRVSLLILESIQIKGIPNNKQSK